ncbi:MAG TPA: hypothetical protein VH325_17825 [Bryobacteraceae bacterium]|jgi:hypothetical protein|nr:hypothetical protein [Bryobacteraceae bacterium]
MSLPASKKGVPRAFRLLFISLIVAILVDLSTHSERSASVRAFVSSWQTGLQNVSVAGLWNDFWTGVEKGNHGSKALGVFTFIADAYDGVSYAVARSWDGNWVSQLLASVYCVVLIGVVIAIFGDKEARGKFVFAIPIASVAVLAVLTCLAWLCWATLWLLLHLFGGFLQITALVATGGLVVTLLWQAIMNTLQQLANDRFAPVSPQSQTKAGPS